MMAYPSIPIYSIYMAGLIVFLYYWPKFPVWISNVLKRSVERPAQALVFLFSIMLLLGVLGFWEWDFWNWAGVEWLQPLLSITLWSLWIAVLEALIVLAFSVWPLWIAIAAFAVLYKK